MGFIIRTYQMYNNINPTIFILCFSSFAFGFVEKEGNYILKLSFILIIEGLKHDGILNLISEYLINELGVSFICGSLTNTFWNQRFWDITSKKFYFNTFR